MLKTRIITALIILPVVLAALFFLPRGGWACFSLGIMVVAAWEWSRFCGFTPLHARLYLVLAGLLAAALGYTYFFLPPAQLGATALALLGGAALFWVVLVPLWLLGQWRARASWANGIAGFLVIFPTWLAMLLLRDAGPWVILSFAAVAWVADIAAYFSGKKFGKRKLAPAISPGKTVEGVIGGVIAVVVYFFLWEWLTGLAPASGLQGMRRQDDLLLVFILLGLVSVVGDLFESWMKRGANLKDSSNLLPGHGGVLDRIDALTSLLPLAALYLLV